MIKYGDMATNDTELTNFKIKDQKVDLNKIIETYWVNNADIIRDFSLNIVRSTFFDFNDSYKENVERSWGRLRARAQQKLFPSDSAFSLYDQKDIRWEGFENNDPKSSRINVSKGISYKTIVSIRSDEKLYAQLDKEKSPKAFVSANILITSDNKLVMGKRKFYGDWPSHTYECPGAFLHEEDLEINSINKSARNKIMADYQTSDFGIKTIPFVVYYLPRILEVVLVCISTISLSSKELKSLFYEDVLSIENTKEGLNKLIHMPLDIFHPPSRVIIQFYYENILVARRLLKELD